MYPDRGLFIGGTRRQHDGGEDSPVHDPATGGARRTPPAASARDTRDAVASADRGGARRRAVPAWTRADDLHGVSAFERATMGLGGDAPMIVSDGADLDGALDLAVPAGCADAGQGRAAPDPAAARAPFGGIEQGGDMGRAGVAGGRTVKLGRVQVGVR